VAGTWDEVQFITVITVRLQPEMGFSAVDLLNLGSRLLFIPLYVDARMHLQPSLPVSIVYGVVSSPLGAYYSSPLRLKCFVDNVTVARQRQLAQHLGSAAQYHIGMEKGCCCSGAHAVCFVIHMFRTS